MFKSSLRPILLSVLFLCALGSLPSQAQLVIGQYKDEAPFRTWNAFGLLSSASLSTGGSHYAHALDLSSALTNPSQLSRLPKFMVLVNGSMTNASFFKYSIVNTGPVTTDENSSMSIYSLDLGGISFNLNGWGFALSTSILENYDRPSAFYQYRQRGSVYYQFDFEQTGLLRNINAAVSKNLGNRLSVGLGFNLVSGKLSKNLEEEYYSGAILITDDKSHKLKGFYINGGITFQVFENFSAAAVFRTPFKKTSDSESSLQYKAPQASTDILIRSQEESSFQQPLVLGMGFNYRIRDQFRVAADATYFNWASYQVTLFGEQRPREFKDIITLGAGLEYSTQTQLFGLPIDIPWWLGFHYDPQPVTDLNTSYLYLTFGTGVELNRFFVHAGAALGYEQGSGDRLKARRVVVTLGYRIDQ